MLWRRRRSGITIPLSASELYRCRASKVARFVYQEQSLQAAVEGATFDRPPALLEGGLAV